MNLASIEAQPKGVVRDFYIYEYLQNSTSEEALKLYDLIETKSPKIIRLLKSKIPQESLPKSLYCADLSFEKLIASDDECLNLGFRLQYAQNHKISKELLSRIKSTKTQRQIQILQKKNVLNALLDSSGEDFNDIYFAISNKEEIFNRAPSALERLSNKNYAKALYHMVINQKYPRFTKALLKYKFTGLNDWSFFALGLNELKFGSQKKAMQYFTQTKAATKSKFLADKATFWQYQISRKEQYIRELAQSDNFNIYSLFATQKLKTTPKFEIITQDDAIFKDISDAPARFNISNPFEWQILQTNIVLVSDKDALLDIAKMFYYKDTLPHFTFVLNRYYGFSKHFFITPYDENLEFDSDTKNLVYAIAKQESRFIPSVVSRSYALGIMQIMPFNVPSFAKEQNLPNPPLESMFNPATAMQFGAYYINHLKKEFKHPLFIAYAYNGGPTFIRKFLKDEQVFSSKNKYDPWLSMEFIPFEESRTYGLKVVANYIIYNQISGNDINVEEFLKEVLR